VSLNDNHATANPHAAGGGERANMIRQAKELLKPQDLELYETLQDIAVKEQRAQQTADDKTEKHTDSDKLAALLRAMDFIQEKFFNDQTELMIRHARKTSSLEETCKLFGAKDIEYPVFRGLRDFKLISKGHQMTGSAWVYQILLRMGGRHFG
jgi:hypothetical protein